MFFINIFKYALIKSFGTYSLSSTVLEIGMYFSKSNHPRTHLWQRRINWRFSLTIILIDCVTKYGAYQVFLRYCGYCVNFWHSTLDKEGATYLFLSYQQTDFPLLTIFLKIAAWRAFVASAKNCWWKSSSSM